MEVTEASSQDIPVSCKAGEGIEAWCLWLQDEMKQIKKGHSS